MKAKALRTITINNFHYKQWEIYEVEELSIGWRTYFEAIKVAKVEVAKEEAEQVEAPKFETKKKKRK